MPAVSLVVCVHNQRDLLERLLQESQGGYDELVVVHDGPDETGVGKIVTDVGGRFFERPRAYQQEPHWPFAWEQAKYDWILRLDADEFPSAEMKKWLKEFRHAPKTLTEVSGYTCIWPIWNGRKTVTKNWPADRIFLFNKKQVRFIGMAETVPIPDGRYEPLNIVLHHQPRRKSHTLHNILVRKQAYIWRERIVASLLGKPTDLTCWRWEDENWPLIWEEIRRRPLWTAFIRLVIGPQRELRNQWRTEGKFFPLLAMCGPIHHVMICLKFWQMRRQHLRKKRLGLFE